MIWRFLSRVGKKQAGNALETFTQAVVAFDPETASEAQISLMEEELDKLGVRVGKAEQAVKKDHEETQALLTQYNRYMSAAERLEGQLQQADDNERTSLDASMAKLIDELERLQPEIDREKQEDQDAESFAAELRQAYDEAAEKLKKSKTQLTQAQRRMEQARLQKERSEERAQSVRESAGLSSSMGGLDTALSAMEKESEKAENASRAAELKIGAFGKQEITDDPNISAVQQMNSDSERRNVLMAYIKENPIDNTFAEVFVQTIDRMKSDTERRNVLLAFAERTDLNDQAKAALLASIDKMQSDAERRNVLLAISNRIDLLNEETVNAFLRSTQQMNSNAERRNVLLAFIKTYPANQSLPVAFDEALQSFSSDAERRNVLLAALAERPNSDGPGLDRLLEAVEDMQSSSEKRNVLIKLVDRYPKRRELPDTFYRTTGGINSISEFIEVYAMVINRTSLSRQTVSAILASTANTRRIDADNVRSSRRLAEFLIELAFQHRIDGDLISAYRNAANVIPHSGQRERVLSRLEQE